MRCVKVLVITTICFISFHTTSGQDLDVENIAKSRAIKLSGGLSMMNRFYSANGIENRQSPYIWTFRANLNISLFGIATPLSGTITSQNKSFNQPYNRLSLRPHYKWAKAYIGYSNMTYSNYTMSGHTFLGGGVELNPKKIRFAANYGRFAAAIPFDKPTNQPFVPTFNRIGYGTKIGYGTDENYIDLILFKGTDDENSWSSIPDSTAVFPSENMVVGTAWKISLIKNLSLSGEFARSAFTTDKRDEIIDKIGVFSTFGIDKKSTTKLRNALKVSANYKIKSNAISGTYERIDPEYQTMGTYFFNNDIENITAGFSTNFFENKLLVSTNVGSQRNNLSGNEISTSTRTILAGNVTYVKDVLTLGLSHSNYSSDVEFVLNSSLDSLNAVVVTEATSLNSTYILKSTDNKNQVITAMVSRQAVTNDFSGDRDSDNKNFNGVINYTMSFPTRNTSFMFRLNYNRNDLEGVINERFGPGVTAKKMFFDKKLTTQLGMNYFNQEGNTTNTIMLQSSLMFKSHHSATLNASRIDRSVTSAIDGIKNRFGETIITINYTYTF